MRRDLHPLIVLTVDALGRRFGVEPADLWAWLERRAPAPRWFVDAAIETYYPGLRETDFDIDESLASVPNSARMEHVSQPQVEPIVGRKPTKHPFTAALRKRGMTLTEWAATNGVGRGAVKSWFLPGVGGRRIPRKWADAIEREFRVPATRRTWPHGIIES